LVVVVITASGVMLRSLHRLANVDPGFQTSKMVAAQVAEFRGVYGTRCMH
jgi:hypothetical protein